MSGADRTHHARYALQTVCVSCRSRSNISYENVCRTYEAYAAIPHQISGPSLDSMASRLGMRPRWNLANDRSPPARLRRQGSHYGLEVFRRRSLQNAGVYALITCTYASPPRRSRSRQGSSIFFSRLSSLVVHFSRPTPDRLQAFSRPSPDFSPGSFSMGLWGRRRGETGDAGASQSLVGETIRERPTETSSARSEDVQT